LTINKLYEDDALGNIKPDRYRQLSKKYSEEYYSLKKERDEIQERLSDHEIASGRAKNFIKLVENYCAFTEARPPPSMRLSARLSCMSGI
jgi:hypothetical protein